MPVCSNKETIVKMKNFQYRLTKEKEWDNLKLMRMAIRLDCIILDA